MDAVALRTARLLLRPWRVEEAAVQRDLWAERDPRVPAHRRLDASGRPSVTDLAARIRAWRPEPYPGLLAVEVAATGEAVGYCGLIAWTDAAGEPVTEEAEIAYELLARAQGRGYATESARAVVAAAQGRYRRLWATVRAWNEPSLRVLDRLGFAPTGRVDPDADHGDSAHLALDLPRRS